MDVFRPGQHRWYASAPPGHYGRYGLPHNWRLLNGVPQEVRRCLTPQSQNNRRMARGRFEL